MKLLTFLQDGREQPGVLDRAGTGVLPLESLGLPFESVLSLIETASHEQMQLLHQATQDPARQGIKLSMVKLLAPIPYFRRDMICIGYNFRNHAQEIARLRGESDKSAEVANPIYFSKRTAYSTGSDAPIPFVPGYAENLDCGVEVAAVIGRDALNITPEAAGDYIFGYTIANDVCDTRLNKAYTQPFLGKSVDGYMPTGPWIVTADEFAREPYFDLRLTVNGTLRQTGNTRDLVFGIPFIISQLSRNMTLKAGTMISTGSPANLDAGHPDKLYIHPGDVIRCEIAGIGSLTNPVEVRQDREERL